MRKLRLMRTDSRSTVATLPADIINGSSAVGDPPAAIR